jgi:hypothetical protein
MARVKVTNVTREITRSCQTILFDRLLVGFLSIAQGFNNDLRTEDCSRSDLCHLRISESNKEERTFEHRCIPQGAAGRGELHISYRMHVEHLSKRFQCNFYCDYNRCNSAEAGTDLLAVIETHHSITDLLEILNFRGREIVENIASTTVATTTVTMQNSGQPRAPVKILIYALHVVLGIHLLQPRT